MKFVALFLAVLVASSSALDTAEFTFANSRLQKLKDAVTVQVTNAQDSISHAFWAELSFLMEVRAQVLSEVKKIGNAKVLTDVTALIDSITAKVTAKFSPNTLAQNILAPYVNVLTSWYAKISKDIAVLNSAKAPVKIACLKTVQASINGNITDLPPRVGNKISQQLATIQSRFNAVNTQINAALVGLQTTVATACGLDSACAAARVST